MTMRGLGHGLGAGLCALILAWPGPRAAWAAKDSTLVAKVVGESHMTRVAPDGTWLASWVLQSDKSYVLYVIDAKGAKQQVETTQFPGGATWIPGVDKLLFCKAAQGGPTKINH